MCLCLIVCHHCKVMLIEIRYYLIEIWYYLQLCCTITHAVEWLTSPTIAKATSQDMLAFRFPSSCDPAPLWLHTLPFVVDLPPHTQKVTTTESTGGLLLVFEHTQSTSKLSKRDLWGADLRYRPVVRWRVAVMWKCSGQRWVVMWRWISSSLWQFSGYWLRESPF